MESSNLSSPSSNEQKSFFDLLAPRQAFLLGCITSFLVMGTLGFVALGAYVMNGGSGIQFVRAAEDTTSDDGAAAAGIPIKAPAAAAAAPTVPSGTVPAVSGTDHVRGNENAAVTIIEYSDFQCPYCSKFHPTMLQVMDEYEGQVRWVYRHYPLSFHPEAQPSAIAAECAGQQGKFWEYADALFENQSSLGETYYTQLAKDLGLDSAKFNSCRSSQATADLVDAQMQGGVNAGVSGTPGSFIIDASGEAQVIKGALPYSSIKTMIDAALQ